VQENSGPKAQKKPCTNQKVLFFPSPLLVRGKCFKVFLYTINPYKLTAWSMQVAIAATWFPSIIVGLICVALVLLGFS
jgi:hypothetical protein